LAFGDLLGSTPGPIERQVILRVVSELTSHRENVNPEASAAAICGLLLGADLKRLSLADLVDIADRVCRVVPTMYFKPHPDGAAHWTVRLTASEDAVCTVSQMDDSTVIAGTAMVIALMLSSLAPLIREEVLGSESLPRHEVRINIVTHRDLAKYLGPEVTGLGDELTDRCVVSESTDVTRCDQPPIIAICRDDFGERWSPLKKRVSDAHVLFGRIVEVMVSHLFARAVEREALHPKLLSLIQKSASPL
jgi:hypothetical protein